MTDSFIFTAAMILLSLFGLIALFIFGKASLETLIALFEILLRTLGRTLKVMFTFLGNAFLAFGWYVLGTLLVSALIGGWLAYNYWVKPGTSPLTKYRPPVCAELLDRKGAVIDYACPFDGVRIWRPLAAFDAKLRSLVVTLEDDKFYAHGGLDIEEIWNSLEEDLAAKKLARGGSTITQQLAKNLFLNNEKSLFRKASEVPMALRIEKELTKDQILELYLNTIEWGPGIFGAEAASRVYFDHDAYTLKEEEAWLLALMIPNPRELNLWLTPKAKKSILKRAKHLSIRLYQEHKLNREESAEALGRFEEFLEKWIETRPKTLRKDRNFPLRWKEDDAFSLGEIAAVRKKAFPLLKLFKTDPLRSTLDRETQDELEALQKKNGAPLRPQESNHVLALMEDSQIRAMVPLASKDFPQGLEELEDDTDTKAQLFPAKNIPVSALWQ